MSEHNDLATWWTPTGFEQRLPPSSFLEASTGMETDWHRALRDAGYAMECSSEDEIYWSSQVWDHRSGHLFVCLVERTDFFVDKVHAAAFWTGLYPSIQAAEHDERRTIAVERQSKALIAWIRHGHGKHVVAEDGHTLEENQRDTERLRAMQAERQKPKA